MSKTINKYPDWVEKYRSKGKTIRKTKYGYGLYKCSSVYVKDGKPKSTQEFLGMIYKDKGFVPKQEKIVNSYEYLEYGLSKFIIINFNRELKRTSYDKNETIVKLGVVSYCFNGINESLLRKSFLTYKDEELIAYYKNNQSKRINTIYKRIDELFRQKISDDNDRNTLINLLKLMVIDKENLKEPVISEEVRNICDRYGLKLW